METQSSVARGATSLYVANVAVLLANTAYFLVLTNILHSTIDVGVVTALNIMIWLLVTICIFAQPVTLQSPIPAPLAVLKFVPEIFFKGAAGGVGRLFRHSLIMTGGMALAVALILNAAPQLVVPLVGGEVVLPVFIRLSAADVFALSLGQICLGMMIAGGDLKRASGYIIAWSVARYSIASILLFHYTITGVLVGFIIGDIFLLIVTFLRSRHDLRATSSTGFSSVELFRYSLYTLLSALMGFAINQADKLFTLARQGLRELAIYNVAIVASTLAGFAPYALLTVLLPALSALRATNRIKESRQMVRAYTRYVSIIVTPVAVGLASLMELALRIFGQDYVVGLAPAIIVSVATGLTAVGSVYAAALLASGEMKWYTAANACGLLGLLGVSAMMTPVIGLNGPALGRAALMAITLALYGFATRRIGFLELDAKAFGGAAFSAIVMGIVVFAVESALASFLLKLAMVPVLIVGGGLIYLGLLRTLRLLTPDDVEFVAQIVPSRLQPLIPKLAKLVRAQK